jgi:hypothetical protein
MRPRASIEEGKIQKNSKREDFPFAQDRLDFPFRRWPDIFSKGRSIQPSSGMRVLHKIG